MEPTTGFAEWWLLHLAGASWQIALLVVLVGIVAAAGRRLPAAARYGLWLLVLVKVFTPPSFGLPWSFGTWAVGPVRRIAAQTFSVGAERMAQKVPAPPARPVGSQTDGVSPLEGATDFTPLGPVAVVPLPRGDGNLRQGIRLGAGWPAALLGLWASGIVCFLGFLSVKMLRLHRLLGRAETVSEGPLRVELDGLALCLGPSPPPALLLSDEVTSPFLTGMWQPRIVLPTGLPEQLGAAERECILLHELLHWKRRDLAVGWIQVLAQALFWFHPFVWFANARIRHERECAVDEAVLAFGDGSPRGYGEALLKVLLAARARPAGALGLLGVFERNSRLQNRLEEIMNMDIAKSRRLRPYGWALVAAFALVFLPMAAPQSGVAEDATTAPAASPAVPGVVEDAAFLAKLNDQQRAIYDWTNRQFRKFFDYRTFPDLSDAERAKMEDKLIDTLRGPVGPEYYQAINTLAALKSRKAAPALLQIAADRAEKDNRDRWMAIRALGVIGDKTGVPEFIHLTYHPNTNTRFWAQITLVRLTGENFGTDWEAWGKWWNARSGQPPFKPEKIAWSANAEYMDPAKQREADAKFVADATGRNDRKADATPTIQPQKAAAPPDLAETLDRLKEICRAGFRKAVDDKDAAGAARILGNALFDAEKAETACKGTPAEMPVAKAVGQLRKAVDELKNGRLDEGVELLKQLNEQGPELETAIRALNSTPGGAKAEAAPTAPTKPEFAGPEPKPDWQAMKHTPDWSDKRMSLSASGEAVSFKRPAGKPYVEMVRIFASRYGSPEAPKEDFHLMILNSDKQVLADIGVPYSTIERGDMKWYAVRTPAVEVPEEFMVALSFNASQTKGVYLGWVPPAGETHSWTGLPDDGFTADAKREWMVGAFVSAQPDSELGVKQLKDWSPPKPENLFPGASELKLDNGKSDGKQSYGGSGPAIALNFAADGFVVGAPLQVKGLRVYGSRYGSGYPAETTFVKVAVLDGSATTTTGSQTAHVLGEARVPYSLFAYKEKWVDLVFDKPIVFASPNQELVIALDPEAQQSKGIYFHYNKLVGGRSHSFAGKVESGFSAVPEREWMIRVMVEPQH